MGFIFTFTGVSLDRAKTSVVWVVEKIIFTVKVLWLILFIFSEELFLIVAFLLTEVFGCIFAIYVWCRSVDFYAVRNHLLGFYFKNVEPVLLKTGLLLKDNVVAVKTRLVSATAPFFNWVQHVCFPCLKKGCFVLLKISKNFASFTVGGVYRFFFKKPAVFTFNLGIRLLKGFLGVLRRNGPSFFMKFFFITFDVPHTLIKIFLQAGGVSKQERTLFWLVIRDTCLSVVHQQIWAQLPYDDRKAAKEIVLELRRNVSNTYKKFDSIPTVRAV